MARAKKHEEEEHENHERWLITYADMITLLMVLFIVLFSMATVDNRKFAALKDSLAGVKHNSASVLQGSPSVLTGGAIQKLQTTPESPSPIFNLPTLPTSVDSSAAKDALHEKQKKEAAQKTEMNNLKQVKQEIEASLEAKGLADQVNFNLDRRGLTITIVTDKVLFDLGKADIKSEGLVVLEAVGAPLSHLPNDIVIEGHTDNQPISTPLFPSNWELSTTRATSVLRYLVDHRDVTPARIGATGYGEMRPTVPNDSDAHRAQNRRVEVIVLNSANDVSDVADVNNEAKH